MERQLTTGCRRPNGGGRAEKFGLARFARQHLIPRPVILGRLAIIAFITCDSDDGSLVLVSKADSTRDLRFTSSVSHPYFVFDTGDTIQGNFN